MTVRFKRKGNRLTPGERWILKRKQILDQVAAEPTVEVHLEAGDKRSAGKNTKIFNTHRKRLGRALRIMAREGKDIGRAAGEARKRYKESASRGDLHKFAGTIGEALREAIKAKIKGNDLWDTGELFRSVAYRVKNV